MSGKNLRLVLRLSEKEKIRLAQLCERAGINQSEALQRVLDATFTADSFSFELQTKAKLDRGTELLNQSLSIEFKEAMTSFCKENELAITRILSIILNSLGDSDLISFFMNTSKKTDYELLDSRITRTELNRVKRISALCGVDYPEFLHMILATLTDGEISALLFKNPALTARFNEVVFFEKLITEITPLLQSAVKTEIRNQFGEMLGDFKTILEK